jgi:excisionase family DNA binding protein
MGNVHGLENPNTISEQDQRDILDLYGNIYSFLCQLLGDLKAGKSVTILQSDAALTTMEAARMLAVSRQFLVELLNQNQIPFHMVGTHRRIYVRNLLAYKGRRDSARRSALDDLARQEMDEGLYDRVPLDPDAR